MIKVDKGMVSISGAHPLVMAELSTLVHELYFNVLPNHMNMTPDEAKKEISRAVEMGFNTEEQAADIAKEIIGKSIAELVNALVDSITKQNGKDDE